MSAALNSSEFLSNDTFKDGNSSGEAINLYPFTLVVPFTVVYVVIFVTGVIGNVSTCVVISKNKCMHTATNYYLFSLAVSDLLLLISGLPPEMYRIWSPDTYVFGEAFCVLQGFAAETSANATVLTITAFTVERYLAICHPFLSHTMSKLSRAVRYIVAIWVFALLLAVPQASQFGIESEVGKDGAEISHCTVVKHFFQHAFEISTFVFFVGPMTLITILYVLIGCKLRKSKRMASHRPSTLSTATNASGRKKAVRCTSAQNRVVKMLVAVVVAFFVCWAPFHAQRLLAVYLSNASREAQEAFTNFYLYLMYTSGVLYFVSTTINPVLYHIMSRKFRKAFKNTFSMGCSSATPIGHYQVIGKVPPSMRNMQRSVSDGVTHQATAGHDFLGCRRGQARHSSVTAGASSRSRGAVFLSSFGRTNSLMYERNRALLVAAGRKSSDHGNFFYFLPLKFSGLFSRNGRVEGNAYSDNTDSANTISNSSLKDTDVTEFNYSDLVTNMLEINEHIT